MTQQEKAFLNLAGEFAVASELNRRKILASVTYGASKCADVFALSPDMNHVVRIEVKATTTKKKRWVIGAKGTKPANGRSDVFWVMVRFPEALNGVPNGDTQCGEHAPRFFVMSQSDVYEAFKKEHDDYIRRRGGRPFDELGVPGVRPKDIEQHEGQWQKIISCLQLK